ncbi:TPA: hypothetical protein I8Y04_002595 [Raoultella planticola]|uniref:hypothetical protein n=1 Tax=Raoultella planticola TaxID=575 RepID=UPI001A1A79E7|nr:hypothetical protein [Raoultella planticola]
MARILAHSVVKVAFYILLSLVVGRTLGNPEAWMSHELASQIGHLVYGPGEVGADNFYDLYFYISVIVVFSITTVLYLLIMMILRKIRSQ